MARIEAGTIPVVMLVRDGAVIPHAAVAQSTSQIDWSHLELRVFADAAREARGLVCLPSDNVLRPVRLTGGPGGFTLAADPSDGKVTWSVQRAAASATHPGRP